MKQYHSPIAFYVHHHGSGHATRVRQLAEHWRGQRPIHVLTSAPQYFRGWRGGRVHVLPPDVSAQRDPQLDTYQDRVFHYAPTGLKTISERMHRISSFIHEFKPALMIVDLSVEVTQFCRLCGVKVVSTRLHGERNDLAHLECWRNSCALIAPFHSAMEDAHTPPWVVKKTIYLGAYSRYDQRPRGVAGEVRRSFGIPANRRLAVIINGRGGEQHPVDYWRQVARQHDDWDWWLLGRLDQAKPLSGDPENLRILGEQADTYPYLQAADVVIGSGGTNTIFEIGAARKPICCIPEPRPFNEQLCKARALERLGLAIVRQALPAYEEWRSLLLECRLLRTQNWNKIKETQPLSSAARQLERHFSSHTH